MLSVFVVSGFGFLATVLLFAEPPLDELTWTTVLLGNFLAAIGMASYLWLRHADAPVK
jgi:hypothetical protein